MPNAWAFMALFLVISLHILFHLMGRWLTWFKAAALYEPTTRVQEGAVVHVTPLPHRGKADLATLKRSSRTGQLVFTFQVSVCRAAVPTAAAPLTHLCVVCVCSAALFL